MKQMQRMLKRDQLQQFGYMSIPTRKLATSTHLKVFATPELADEWFKENDPEGVVFGTR